MTQPLGMDTHAPSDGSVRKGKKILEQAVASGRLSEEGLSYLQARLNPFDDEVQRISGEPDVASGRTVVQPVTKSSTISAPAGVSGSWNLAIFNWSDFLGNSTGGGTPAMSHGTTPASGPMAGGNVATLSNSGALLPASGVVAVAWSAASANWYDPATGVLDATAVVSWIDFADQVKGKCRLIAGGMETTNVTAQLYKGGTATLFRMDQIRLQDVWSFPIEAVYAGDSVATGYIPVPTIRGTSPPCSISEALLINGSKQWGAEFGSYQVFTRSQEFNPIRARDYQCRVYTRDSYGLDSEESTSVFALRDFLSGAVLPGPPVLPSVGNWTQVLHTPIDMSGVYYTGLANQSAITLTVKAIFEVEPDIAHPFLTIAQPTCPYDPVALELAPILESEVPVGVPVAENGIGEWFGKVLGFVSDAAPVIGTVLGMPALGGAIGAAAGLGSKALAPTPRPSGRSAAPVLTGQSQASSSNSSKTQYAASAPAPRVRAMPRIVVGKPKKKKILRR